MILPDYIPGSEGIEGLSDQQEPPQHRPSYNPYLEDQAPPPPQISSPGIVAFDVTKRFLKAAQTLEPGSLVKDGYFSLMDSVGSIEIMDPKMDSGCLEPGESLDEDYDVTRPLTAQQVVGIIDQLLCHEMAWHLGYPLSQTLFTNVYIEGILMPDPRLFEEADFVRGRDEPAERNPMLTVLRAYCLGMLKACYYVNERIKGEHYYEEEDFVTNTFHRSLLDDIDESAIRTLIQKARALVDEQSGKTIAGDIAEALVSRLRLRDEFLVAIRLSEDRSSSDSLKTPWIRMEELLGTINRTHSLGEAVPEAFSTKIQRKLASTMPPRPIVDLSFEDAHGHLRRLFGDGKEVTDVLQYTDSQSLLSFVFHFQAKKPQPLVYIRTLLQSYLFKDMVILGSLSIRHIMDDDLATVVLPISTLLDPAHDAAEAPQSTAYQIADKMELFRQRAAQSYLDIFRAFCQNRCRIRRTLCHSIRDWENVQLDAEEVDQALQAVTGEAAAPWPPRAGSAPTHSLSLSSWAYLYKLKLMGWIVQLGFELDIYAPDELAGMYWYLGLLTRTRSQHVQRIQAFAERAARETMRSRALTVEEEARFDRSASYWRADLLDAATTCQLAEALSSLYAALGRLGLLPAPPRPYSTDALRHEVRMRPFAAVGLPESPSFETMAAAARQDEVPARDLLEAASRSLEGAKKGLKALERLEEDEAFARGVTYARYKAGLANGTRSAIAAGLAIIMLRKAVGEEEEEGAEKELGFKVEVKESGKRYHAWWVVPGLVKV